MLQRARSSLRAADRTAGRNHFQDQSHEWSSYHRVCRTLAASAAAADDLLLLLLLLSPSYSYSLFPDEAEVLLSPNARFVVTSECTLEVLLLLRDVEACHSSP